MCFWSLDWQTAMDYALLYSVKNCSLCFFVCSVKKKHWMMPEWHEPDYAYSSSGRIKSIKTFYAAQNFRFRPILSRVYCIILCCILTSCDLTKKKNRVQMLERRRQMQKILMQFKSRVVVDAMLSFERKINKVPHIEFYAPKINLTWYCCNQPVIGWSQLQRTYLLRTMIEDKQLMNITTLTCFTLLDVHIFAVGAIR